MSVLGLDSGYTVKYPLRLQEFPRASPSGTPSGGGVYIWPYIPPLVLIRIESATSLWADKNTNSRQLLDGAARLHSYESLGINPNLYLSVFKFPIAQTYLIYY